jgi:hypothetical protein
MMDPIPDPPDFAFVPFTRPGQAPSRDTLSMIRKHAMKDIGKARRRTARRGQQVYHVRSPVVQSSLPARMGPAVDVHGSYTDSVCDSETCL